MDTTRRGFLCVSAVAPALIRTIEPAIQPVPPEATTNLATIMDLLIPESDGMPSATQAAGLPYLQALMHRDKDVATDISKALEVAEAFSMRSFQKPFGSLAPQDQIAVLTRMESTALGVFDLLRAYVYESYYLQPGIWKLIGYELYPTDHAGPHMKPFDESLVANVRKMPKLYREA